MSDKQCPEMSIITLEGNLAGQNAGHLAACKCDCDQTLPPCCCECDCDQTLPPCCCECDCDQTLPPCCCECDCDQTRLSGKELKKHRTFFKIVGDK